jgi:hypothetical protein
MPQNMAQPPTVQRAIMNRHHQARRSVNSNIAPKLEPVGGGLGHHSVAHSNASPQSRPTPSSQHSSSNPNSPGFQQPGGVMTPPASDSQIQQQQQRIHQALKPQMNHGLPLPAGAHGSSLGSGLKGPGSGGTGAIGGSSAVYYPSPFQNHQLELGKLTRPLLSIFF